MQLREVADLTDFSPEEFDRLDSTAGSAACYERLLQRQADGRWQTTYLAGTDNGQLMALIPLYRCRTRTWPDPAYDPDAWPVKPPEGRDNAPASCLLAGGCTDLRTGWHVRPDALTEPSLGRIVDAIAAIAAGQDRHLVFPYVFPPVKDALDAATGGRISWVTLGEEARLRDVLDAEWEQRLGARVRGVWRRDRRLIAASGAVVAWASWPEAEELASDLIAAHNVRKGQFDHREFVRMRYREWGECQSVRLATFTVSLPARPDIRGVLTALVWQRELELYEIGLSGEPGPERLAAYLTLLFHEPLRYARAHRLPTIRLGLGAQAAKGSRGAEFVTLHGGILDPAGTGPVRADGGSGQA